MSVFSGSGRHPPFELISLMKRVVCFRNLGWIFQRSSVCSTVLNALLVKFELALMAGCSRFCKIGAKYIWGQSSTPAYRVNLWDSCEQLVPTPVSPILLDPFGCKRAPGSPGMLKVPKVILTIIVSDRGDLWSGQSKKSCLERNQA